MQMTTRLPQVDRPSPLAYWSLHHRPCWAFPFGLAPLLLLVCLLLDPLACCLLVSLVSTAVSTRQTPRM